jgi:hypothetical protein
MSEKPVSVLLYRRLTCGYLGRRMYFAGFTKPNETRSVKAAWTAFQSLAKAIPVDRVEGYAHILINNYDVELSPACVLYYEDRCKIMRYMDTTLPQVLGKFPISYL